MLESKVVELNEELNEAKKKIKKLEENQDKLSHHSKIVFLYKITHKTKNKLNGLLVERKNLYDKLDQVLSKNCDESEINLLLDSLSVNLNYSFILLN